MSVQVPFVGSPWARLHDNSKGIPDTLVGTPISAHNKILRHLRIPAAVPFKGCSPPLGFSRSVYSSGTVMGAAPGQLATDQSVNTFLVNSFNSEKT